MSTKMKILFDAGPIMERKKSGVGYYTQGLITALAETYPNELELTGYYFNFLGRKNITFDIDLPNVHFKPIRFFPGIILSPLARICGIQFPIETFVWRRYDVHLFPNFVSLPSIRRTPSVITIHDIAYVEHPEYIQDKNLAYLRRLVPRSLRRASHILTVSKFTRDEVQRHFHPSAPITVTHIPPQRFPTSSHDLPQRLAELGIRAKKFFLFLGNIEPRKNLITLLKAYALLPSELRAEYSVVLAGGKGWHDDEIMATIEALQKDNNSVITTGYVSEEEKDALYTQAHTVVLPAYYEGFGIPALEAMTFHAPVLLSDIPPFREIAHENATYFNPTDPQELSQKLESSIRDGVQPIDDAQYKQLMAEYNWATVADAVHAALKELRK